VSATTLDLEVIPKSATIGADVLGIDLKRPLDPDAAAAVRALLLRHKVIFFPGQHLNPAQHLEFARALGEPTPAHPVIPGIEGYPEIFEIDYTKARAAYGSSTESDGGLSWHSDVTYVERPPLGSILNAVVMPPSGGDTQFSNQQAAYEALSESLREYLAGLTALHSGKKQFGAQLKRRKNGGDWEGEPVTALEPAEHPVVRTHPETKARGLFVNPGFTQRIVQLAPRESQALLAFLYEHSTRPEFVVRHHWHEGDVAFWDNRVTQHSVVGDYGSRHRVIQRITLRGDRPV
jgi:taurine dioxygenase